MKIKLLRFALVYYSFFVVCSLLHFAAPKFEPLTDVVIIAKDTTPPNNTKYLAKK